MNLTGAAEDTVRLTNGVRLLLRRRMTTRLHKLEDIDRTDINTDPIPITDIKVDCNMRPMNPQLRRRRRISPDTMATMLTLNL